MRDTRRFLSFSSDAMYWVMSPPRAGFTTENVPLRMTSPVNRTRSSSSRKQMWFGAWPGVWITSSPNSVPSMLSPSPTVRSGVTTGSRFENATTSAPVAFTRRSVPGA